MVSKARAVTLFPPSDGYLPPEDPLCGVARQIEATARLKAAFPDMIFVGSAYSYLQEFLPNVAQAAVRWTCTTKPSWLRMPAARMTAPKGVKSKNPKPAKPAPSVNSDSTSSSSKASPSAGPSAVTTMLAERRSQESAADQAGIKYLNRTDVLLAELALERTTARLARRLLLLVADLQELKANPNTEASGTVIESHLDPAQHDLLRRLAAGGAEIEVGQPPVEQEWQVATVPRPAPVLDQLPGPPESDDDEDRADDRSTPDIAAAAMVSRTQT